MISKVFPNEDEYLNAQGTPGWPVGVQMAPSPSPARRHTHAQEPPQALPGLVTCRVLDLIRLGYRAGQWVKKAQKDLRNLLGSQWPPRDWGAEVQERLEIHALAPRLPILVKLFAFAECRPPCAALFNSGYGINRPWLWQSTPPTTALLSFWDIDQT